MTLSNLSKQDLEDWQQSNATEVMRCALSRLIDKQQQRLARLYLAGNPVSEEARLAWQLLEVWHENFFDTTLEELKQAIEAE